MYSKQRDNVNTGQSKIWLGGGIPLGYSYDSSLGSLIVNKEEKGILLKIYKMVVEGKGLTSVVSYLNENNIKTRHGKEFKQGTISALLLSSRLLFYLGYDVDGTTKGNWEPLIDKSIYNSLDGRKQIVKKNNKTTASNYLLTGLEIFECKKCGGTVKASVTVKPKRRILYYLCARKQSSGLQSCPDSKLHQQEKIDYLVINDLKVKLSNYSPINMTKFIQEERDEIKKELTSTKINSTKLHKIKDELENLEEIETDVKDGLLPYKGKFNNIAEQQKTILRNISRILLDNDELTIEYKFPINKSLDFKQMLSLI